MLLRVMTRNWANHRDSIKKSLTYRSLWPYESLRIHPFLLLIHLTKCKKLEIVNSNLLIVQLRCLELFQAQTDLIHFQHKMNDFIDIDLGAVYFTASKRQLEMIRNNSFKFSGSRIKLIVKHYAHIKKLSAR